MLLQVSLMIGLSCLGSGRDSTEILHGMIYNRSFDPVVATHVINLSSHEGTISNHLGLFSIAVGPGDTLLFRNIVYRELRVPVSHISKYKYVLLERASYQLEEAKVFDWGSSYDDFRNAIIHMPDVQTPGEFLGWPRAVKDKVPYEMDESYVKSTAFFLTSPISYMYQNYNRKAKSARKLYWTKKNRTKHEHFDSLMSAENISSVTGLEGEELLAFLAYLGQRMYCDFKCSEYRVYAEIYAHWEVYQELNKR